jgi:LacI family transcriptional regulator
LAVTQKDIAREAGVGQGVVSDVLHARPGRRVSEETRLRILQAAEQMGYRANASAQALRTRRSGQVAFLTTCEEASRVLTETRLSGVAAALTEHGYRLAVEVAESPEAVPQRLRELAAARACDGCIIRTASPELWDWTGIGSAGMPVVVLGRCDDPQITSVALDTPSRMEQSLATLRGRGHERIGLLLAGRWGGAFQSTAEEAWKDAAPRFGIDPDRWRDVAGDRRSGDAAIRRWLSAAGPPPTAVVCLNEHAVLGASRAAMRAQRTIGDDFDIVAFAADEGSVWAFEPGTWYFDISREARGRRAAEELLGLLDGRPAPGPVRLVPSLAQVQ